MLTDLADDPLIMDKIKKTPSLVNNNKFVEDELNKKAGKEIKSVENSILDL